MYAVTYLILCELCIDNWVWTIWANYKLIFAIYLWNSAKKIYSVCSGKDIQKVKRVGA